MEITGRLASIGEVKTFDSGFMIEEFYLDCTRFDQNTGEKYSNHVLLQNANERLDLSKFSIGDQLKITFSINGRFYVNANQENRHSQNINAYKVERLKENKDLPDMQGGIDFPYF